MRMGFVPVTRVPALLTNQQCFRQRFTETHLPVRQGSVEYVSRFDTTGQTTLGEHTGGNA